MKQFFSIFAVIFALALTAAPAEAKRFGGGKSFGKTHQTAPKQAPQKQQAAPAEKTNASPAAGAASKGAMGGMLGGLLAGGLLGYMLGNGAFEGIQFMDILLIGLAAFILIKLLKSKAPAQRQTAPAYGGAQARNTIEPPSSQARTPLVTEIGGFGATAVPLNLPSDFDLSSFLIGAREHYRTLQQAWDSNDFSLIEEYVSPELLHELKAERASSPSQQNSEVLFVDAQLVRADCNQQRAELSLNFTGRYRDLSSQLEEEINDTWHLERDLIQANAPWLIVGVES
ncbi:MAG: Tim44-like domain-containing protein [Venatoribacter sp.]